MPLHGFSMDLGIGDSNGTGQWFFTPSRENLHLFSVSILFSPGEHMEDQAISPGGGLTQGPEARDKAVGAKNKTVFQAWSCLPDLGHSAYPNMFAILSWKLNSSLASSITSFQKEEDSSPCPSPDPTYMPPSIPLLPVKLFSICSF